MAAQKGKDLLLKVDIDGTPHLLTGEGNGPIDAAVHAFANAGITAQVRSYEERSMSTGGEASACAFIEVAGGSGGECYGVGIDANIVTASLKALISGVDRSGIRPQVMAAEQAA